MMQEFVQEISDTIEDRMRGIHTAMPGKITAYDASKGLATVLPLMKYKKPDGTTIAYPQITGVPVLFPQGAGQGVSIAFPVKPGDGCLIIIAEQSIDFWLYGYETSTDLAHDMTNAICIPGLFAKAPVTASEAAETNSIVLASKNTKVMVKPDSVTIHAPTVRVEGNLQVDGSVTSNGRVL